MKPFSFSYRIALLAALAIGGLRAAEETATPAALAATPKNGYTVTTEVKVDEKGETTEVTVVQSDDITTGRMLEKLAIGMSRRADLPPREKDGKPIRYTVRAPWHFVIDDDEGPESNNVPKPGVKQAVQPVYPQALWDQGVVGGVILELVVDAEGKLTRLTTLRASHPEFQSAAEEAVRKWEFSPARDGDKTVESRVRLAVVFEDGEKVADIRWRVAPRPMLGTWFVLRTNKPIPGLEEALKAEEGEKAGEKAGEAPPPAEAEKK